MWGRMVSNRFRMLLVLSLAALGGGWGSPALAWWNDDWAYRKEITFDLTPTGADITGATADVPVLIRLSLGNFQYFADAKPDGSDIRLIASDDKTPLKFHIERFDSQAQIAFVWVRVPRLTGGANTDKIFLYYGTKKTVPAASDAAGTYDTSQVLVYHFGAPKGSPQDSTGYKVEPSAFNAEVNPASLIGSGVKFAGGQTITVPANAGMHFAPSKGLTVSAWARIASAQSGQAYIAQLADQGREIVLGLNGDQAFVRYAGGGAPVTVTQTAHLTPNEWHHLALRLGDGAVALYVDGADAGNTKIDGQDIGGVLNIGGSAANNNYFTGELDELEVSSTARSPEWLKAAARSQGMVAPLVIYGGDAQKEGGGESYFATTLRNVTIDGWVIISMLAVMFVAAVLIMLFKSIYLARVGGANSRFLKEFQQQAADAAALERTAGDKSDGESARFAASTLWSLYQHGVKETMKRLEGQAAGADRARILSAQSIEAIRATLDASLVRMTQRLNGQMVWLTIAIAGGPFLGLLGTVVGVMITFAAIAASGEVNINAIAPGTAAALVATVAGLSVAIPCLFGYNYLNTRVKEIGADMRVFVDEFVTRIAETYC